MKLRAYAKLNLTLDVLGLRDGMHEIDSVMTSVSVFDELSVTARADKNIVVHGTPNIPNEKNTAYRMAAAIVDKFDTSGVDITIIKGVPQGAGMGGSSVDAAGVAYAMSEIYGISVAELQTVCATVGSDVWYVLNGGLGRVGGTGERLTALPFARTLYFAVTAFNQSCSSGEVYAAWDKLECVDGKSSRRSDIVAEYLTSGKLSEAMRHFGNDLQKAVDTKSDYAADYLSACKRHGVATVMTGSGSAYYVAFLDEESAQTFCNALRRSGFDTFVCHSVGSGVVEN